MNLETLTEQGVDLRNQFDAAARAAGRPTWTNEQIMQGFVVDVGALMKLVMAKSGARDVADVDAKLGHELADCLWSVLVLARSYGIDLEQEYARMLRGAAASLSSQTPNSVVL